MKYYLIGCQITLFHNFPKKKGVPHTKGEEFVSWIRFRGGTLLLVSCLLMGCFAAPAQAADSLDWPHWRGPRYDGVSTETGLIDDWDSEGGPGSNVLWSSEELAGRSSPIVMNGRVYTIVRNEPGTTKEGEKVVCADAVTGKILWENRFGVYLSDVPDTRVGWSSCTGDPATGHIYSLGVCGIFQCLDGETGETIWRIPLHERFGLLSTYGGRTNVPVICDDLVIISAIVIGWGDQAKPAHRFLGLNKTTGEVVWISSTRLLPYDTTYSTPTVCVLAGQKALVFGSGDGAVWALQPRTGKAIWQCRLSRRGINVSPLVIGNNVYAGHSEENMVGTTMGIVVAIDGAGHGDITDTGQRWRIEELMMGKSSPIYIDGRIYCVDDRAKLHCLDAASGEAVVRRKALGSKQKASPLYADGKIYTFTEDGRWYVLRPKTSGGVTVVSQGRLSDGGECHASPICSHGRLYVQTTTRMYCLQDKEKQPGVSDREPAAEETPVDPNQPVAHVQLVPADALLRPDEKQPFQVRLFNNRGQFLRVAPAEEVELKLAGPGQMDDQGVYTVSQDTGHASATITAKVGPLTGRSRVRIVPAIPWHFDFENLKDLPISWVGARYRHVLRNVDGNQVMVKLTTIPKGTRSRSWFGHSDLHDYTIQADVMGGEKAGKMPDIGLIAQGYTLDLKGAHQELQVRSWTSQLRIAKTVPFTWRPNTWYSMKLRVVNDGDQAVLLGKVWLRGEEEPDQWHVETTDPAPIRTGSPGLFGNAKDAEIVLDNIRVTPNS